MSAPPPPRREPFRLPKELQLAAAAAVALARRAVRRLR